MPLTAKQKMVAYRQRIKENPEKAKVVKKRDRDRKRKRKTDMTAQERKIEKERNRLRVAKHRESKRSDLYRPLGPIQVSSLIGLTPQSMGKAKRKAAAFLPQSPRRKKAVIASLAHDVGLELKKSDKTNGNRGMGNEAVKAVKDFYLNMSWTCPGQKDGFILRGPNKEKTIVQKHYMLTTLKEAHAMFKDQSPDFRISFSKFANLRPPQVQLQENIPHNTCLCRHHENIQLLLQALRKAGIPIPADFRNFIELVVCDQEKEDCIKGTCDRCPGALHLGYFEGKSNHEISWKQWTTKRNTRSEFTGTIEDCFQTLEKQLPNFLRHTFIKRVQSQEFQKERESVKCDLEKVVIQVDYAENFTTKSQNEIQSAYWSYDQLSIFTVCIWERYSAHSMVIISDCLSHDKYAVNYFLHEILKWTENIRHFENIVFFSDGAAQQFKQRYLLCNITLLDRKITWNFFATAHGKGPVDGIGGMVKRLVSREIMSGRAEVKSSLDFAELARKKCDRTTILHISKDEIEKSKPALDEKLQGIRAVPNTKKQHRFTTKQPYSIEAQEHATATSSMTHNFQQNHDADQNEEVSHEGIDEDVTARDEFIEDGNDDASNELTSNGNEIAVREFNNEFSNIHRKYGDGNGFSRYELPNIEDEFADHKDEVDNTQNRNEIKSGNDQAAMNSHRSADENKKEEIMISNLISKWVIVQYSNGKDAKKFVGQVLDMQGSTVSVKFLKKESGKFVWPDTEDIDRVQRIKIISILEEPQMDRRGTLTFKSSF